MAEQKFKRNIAYKLRVGDISNGNPILEEERFSFLELNNKKIIRVNVVGSIVDKFDSEGERKFLSLTIDDGSGQIKLKSFGDDIEKFKNTSQGQTIIVIGVLRYWNNEVYIAPETTKEINPSYLLLRKLEIEKISPNAGGTKVLENKEFSMKDKIIELIKSSETNGGIDLDKIIINLDGNPPEIINSEIQKLLEEGMVFEPRPGMLRWLG